MNSVEQPVQVGIKFVSGMPGQTVWVQDSRLTASRAVAILSTDGVEHPGMIEGRFSRVSIPLDGMALWLNVDYFEVFPEPRSSGSKASGALYIAQSRESYLGWLVQMIPPWRRTSWHHHLQRHEQIFNLAGICMAGIGQDRTECAITRHDVYLPPETWHYLCTGSVAALNLLVISGHPEPLTWEDHHYCEFPDSYPPAS